MPEYGQTGREDTTGISEFDAPSAPDVSPILLLTPRNDAVHVGTMTHDT